MVDILAAPRQAKTDTSLRTLAAASCAADAAEPPTAGEDFAVVDVVGATFVPPGAFTFAVEDGVPDDPLTGALTDVGDPEGTAWGDDPPPHPAVSATSARAPAAGTGTLNHLRICIPSRSTPNMKA